MAACGHSSSPPAAARDASAPATTRCTATADGRFDEGHRDLAQTHVPLSLRCGDRAERVYAPRDRFADLIERVTAAPPSPIDLALDGALVTGWRSPKEPAPPVDPEMLRCRRLLADPAQSRAQPVTVAATARPTDYYDGRFAELQGTHVALELACGDVTIFAYAPRADAAALLERVGREPATVAQIALRRDAADDTAPLFTAVAITLPPDPAAAEAEKARAALLAIQLPKPRKLRGIESRLEVRSPRELAAGLAQALSALPAPRTAEVARLLDAGRPHVDAALPLLESAGLSDRLLAVTTDSAVGRALFGTVGESAVTRLAVGLLRLDAGKALAQLVLAVDGRGWLPSVFAGLVRGGHYETLVSLLGRSHADAALRALVRARPGYHEDALNAGALASMDKRSDWAGYPYDFLIVPGYTPLSATRALTVDDCPEARARLDLAISDWKSHLAPYVVVSGGAVHPSGTDRNEALLMRDYLLAHGVPADAVLAEPFARHSTTNLRNAGRMMLHARHPRGLIVTGFDAAVFDQAFYYAHPTLSTFDKRCERELGYRVGELARVDAHHVAYTPSSDVNRENLADPLDV